MKKVLMIGPDRTVQGGVSGVVNNYYKVGLDKKVELKYIGTMVDGSKFTKLIKAITSYLAFRSCLKDYDIVHIHMASDASYYRKSFFIKAAVKAKKKIVIHQHGGDVQNFYGKMTGKKRAKMAALLNKCDAFIVLAPFLYDFFKDIIDNDKLHIIPNSVAAPDFDMDKKDYDNQNILFLGRICKAKGINELVTAAEHLHEKYPDMKLTLGGFFEDEDLKEKCLSHPDYIECPGWIKGSDKDKLLEDSSIFILPSYFEGMPLSPIEAMYFGCANCNSAISGTLQIFDSPLMVSGDFSDSDNSGMTQDLITSENAYDSVFFNPKDVVSLESALDLLLGSAELRKKIGTCGRKTVDKKYDLNKIVADVCKIYDEIL